MRKEFIAAGFVLFSFMLPQEAHAALFSKLYVFGDSLSDNGNAFNLTGGQVPPSPPYFNGRFSNGPVWVEYLAKELGINQDNFAVGGSTTGINNTIVPGLPGLGQQIQSFVTSSNKADTDGLYIIWAGANDYLGANETNPVTPVTNIANAVTSLKNIGAKNFLVVNLPNLGSLPGTKANPTVANGLNSLTLGHNSILSQSILDLNKLPGINIKTLDFNDLFQQAIAGNFGFTNVNDACLTTTSICTNPDSYLFWDAIHPTTKAHSLIAQSALSVLKPVAVPEPTTAWGLLGLGIVTGTAGVIKRKHKVSSLQKV